MLFCLFCNRYVLIIFSISQPCWSFLLQYKQIVLMCFVPLLLSVGLISLLPAIQSLHSSPTKLNLCHTAITSRGVNRLMEVVQQKCESSNVLEMLDLSDNCLKGDDVTVSVSECLVLAFISSLVSYSITKDVCFTHVSYFLIFY